MAIRKSDVAERLRYSQSVELVIDAHLRNAHRLPVCIPLHFLSNYTVSLRELRAIYGEAGWTVKRFKGEEGYYMEFS